MNRGKICISICAGDVEQLLDRANSASEIADLVEMRLDCLDRIPDDLSNLNIRPNTIITLRPSEEGGNKELTLGQRRSFWANFPFRCGGDLEPDVFEVAPENVFPKICSHHDFLGELAEIDNVYDRLAKMPADILKIAVAANDASDCIEIWRLLERANNENRKIIPIAMGEAGKWTRILGLAHGAYLTYAALESGNETAPGQITARDMIDVYRVKELDKQTGVYGIIAGDTTYTMSPYIHNAAFKAASMNSAFIPFQVSALDPFVTRMVRAETREIELNFKGFSVTNPHKQAIIKHLDHTDDAAAKIGAVNTIKIINEKLHGFNTDADGFISPLKHRFGELKDARIAVVGAGGAARACVYTLKNAAADITIFAREINKAQHLANDFNVRADKLETGNSKPAAVFSDFDVVVNTTPLGTRGAYSNETIATAEQLNGVKLVYDLVYNPSETRLMREAKLTGAETIGGFDMLVAQAARQFEIWTGKKAPVDQMSSAASKRLYDS